MALSSRTQPDSGKALMTTTANMAPRSLDEMAGQVAITSEAATAMCVV